MPRFVWVLCLFMAATICAAQDNSLLLLQKPALSRTQIIFVYAGDLWSVPREGGDAKRLTTGAGVETDPMFSPDGTQIAFTGEYDGNVDVFVMPAEGGFPKRLTHHPGDDIAVGCLRRRSKEDFLPNCRFPWHNKVRFRQMVRGLPTSRLRSGNRRGRGIAAGRRLQSGSPPYPVDESRRFLGTIPTTSTLCGWATKSTSCPTGTGR